MKLLDQFVTRLLDLEGLVKLCERPLAVVAETIDARHPLRCHGLLFLPDVFALIALHLENQVDARIETDDEVRVVVVLLHPS